MELNEILSLKVMRHDLGKEITLREFFHDLLKTLWLQNEGFSGKRPWGNSGWDYDVYSTLIKNNLIPGRLDEENFIVECDEKLASEFVINNIINPLFKL